MRLFRYPYQSSPHHKRLRHAIFSFRDYKILVNLSEFSSEFSVKTAFDSLLIKFSFPVI